MKRIISFITMAIIVTSCVNLEEKQESAKESTNQETEAEQNPKSEKRQYQDIDSREAVIATALMAAPKESRDSCKVIGYNQEGEIVTLREGNNQFIVLADNPNKEGFSAACYHKSLESFMARGRELKAEGKGREEIFEIRGKEIKSGKLIMGNAGSTLHIYYGPNETYHPETSEVEGAKYRYVVYLPYATPETSGLPISPVASNHPWIMDPGTHRAHIMISPLVSE